MPQHFPNQDESTLREFFGTSRGNRFILESIRDELRHRSTAASRQLLTEVEEALANLEETPGQQPPFIPLRPDSPQARAAEPKIRELRQQLLDLSSRNRLLNFKHSPSGCRYIRIVDESAPALFGQLQADRKVELVPIPDPPDKPDDEDTEEFCSTFEQALLTDKSYLKAAKEVAELGGDDAEARLRTAQRALRDRLRRRFGLPARSQANPSLREYAARLNIRPDYDLLDEPPRFRRRRESEWQTLMSYEDLSRRLRGIDHAAREAQQEFGIETLYFVFGFLEWYPATPEGEAEEMLLSPLVLQLTSIQKKRNVVRRRRLLEAETGGTAEPTREAYTLSAADAEEPAVNLTLKERLRADFGLILPDLDPEDMDLASYFEKVARAIRPYPNWRVRHFVTLTHLSFSRLPMWHDLATDDSENLAPHLHPLIGELFGGRKPDPSEDTVAANRRAANAPVLVLDADSSQHSAILSALSGRNLVIQGPPGTGKSQTIANLIAAAMWENKTILFVAEKLVALQAVHKRLAEQAQLGDFILELHSAKSGKKPVIDSIRKRLERTSEPHGHYDENGTRHEHEASLQALDAYAAAINAHFGKLGWTLHDIVWRHLQRVDCAWPAALQTFEFADAEQWTVHDWTTRRSIALEWGELATRRAREPVDDQGRSPWFWVLAPDAYVAEQSRILSHSLQLAVYLEDLKNFVTETGLGESNCKLADLICTEESFRQLGRRPSGIRPGMWKLGSSSQGHSSVEAIVRANRRLEEGKEKVRAIAPKLVEEKDPVSDLGRLGELIKSLTPWHPADSVEDLRQRLAATEAWLEFVPKAVEMINGFGTLMSSEVTLDTPGALLGVANLIELAAATPAAAVGHSMRWDDDQAVATLRAAITQAEALQKLRDQLRKRTAYAFEESSRETFDAAENLLARAWFGSWLFNPHYRAARRFAQQVAPGQSVHDILVLLHDISAYLTQKAALHNHPASSLTGGLFVGIDSDLETLDALADWVDCVRAATPILPPVNIVIRSILLSQRRDLFDLARGLAADQWPQHLEKIASLCEGAHVSANKLPALLHKERGSLQSAIAYCTRWQWTGSIASDTRQAVNKALREIAEAKNVLAGQREAVTILLPDLKAACREFEQVEDALRRINATNLSPAWQQKLSSENGAADWEAVTGFATTLRSQLERTQSELASLAGIAGFAPHVQRDWMEEPIDDLCSRLAAALASGSALPTQCGLLANQVALQKRGLQSFIKSIQLLPEAPSQVGDLLDRVFIRSLCHAAFAKVSALKPFRHASPEVIRQKFRECDETLKKLDRVVLAGRLLERRPPPGNSIGRVSERTEMGLLNYVCGLTAPRTPVRDLLRRSGKALQALKPCFMMSPLSVAQLVDRRSLAFDMVIFDEASQIRPEDALSALARARQFVVVGDSLQLPPTSFGVKSAEAPEHEEEDEEDESPVVESILELAAAAYGQGLMLLWHYRSRDPVLIAFSNKEFYDRKLRLFPAPHYRNPETGVHYVHVADGVYSARTNLVEAQRCARAALEFMRTYPKRSLGIVALNRPQADLIEVELERIISQNSDAAAYCAAWEESIEPLFVKNLESVQGDERDVIFISTVFGEDEEKNFYQRFGPINSKAGHRRLNVLFTRAKYQVVVFSSIPIERIVVAETAHWGVRVLKEYLGFARSGRLESGLRTGNPADSPFEESVTRALTAEGIKCEPQVGVAGFFIDLAVRHPTALDYFVIGIECDGAAYHSTRTARDRDRLRQQILESLGWKIYRIWSTDWFANPRVELQKLVRAIREQIRNVPRGEATVAPSFLNLNRRSD